MNVGDSVGCDGEAEAVVAAMVVVAVVAKVVVVKV